MEKEEKTFNLIKMQRTKDSDEDKIQEEENDEVNEISSRKNKFGISIKTSNEYLCSLNTPSSNMKTNETMVYENSDTQTTESPTNIRKGSKLKKRNKPVKKRASMTDIDLINRQNTIQEIKDSTRKIVAFTLKNLDKEKPIQHFKNDLYIFEDKTKEFDYYYSLGEGLGEGCSSYVRKCVNKETGIEYAVKIFRAYDDEYVNFAKNEFNNMKKVNSASVAKVYEMFYDQNNCKIYTVMEYCEGYTLMKLLKENGEFPGKSIYF